MKIKEIMTEGVITANADASISDIAKLMHEHKIHGVPVVDGSRLVGIITETDFFIKGEMEIHLPSYVDFLTKTGLSSVEKESGSAEFNEIIKAKASDIMTTECVTIGPEDDVKELIKLLKERDLHTVPVTAGDTLVGIVTVADIIKLI